MAKKASGVKYFLKLVYWLLILAIFGSVGYLMLDAFMTYYEATRTS